MHYRARLQLTTALIAALSLSASRSALADDVETARALFEQGVTEMMDGRFRSGCPSVAASYKLDPRTGTLFTLAQCDRHLGRIATAVKKYEEFLALVAKMPSAQRAKQAKRVRDAKADIRTFGPKIPMLTIVLPPDAPKELVVKIDSRVVPRDLVGSPLPVDPEDHVVSSQLPGASAFEVSVELEEGERKIVDLAGRARESAPDAGKRAPVAAVNRPGAVIEHIHEPPQQRTDEPLAARTVRRLRIAGLALGSAAFASLIVGGVTGGLVYSKKSTIAANCSDYDTSPRLCFQQGVDAGNSAKHLALASTIGFVAGGLLSAVTLGVLGSSLRGASPSRVGSTGLGAASVSFVSGGAVLRIDGSFQ